MPSETRWHARCSYGASQNSVSFSGPLTADFRRIDLPTSAQSALSSFSLLITDGSFQVFDGARWIRTTVRWTGKVELQLAAR